VTLSSFEEEAECGQQHEKERGQEASVYEYESSEESSSSNLISVCSMSTSPILSASQLTRLLTLMTFGSLFLYLSVMFIKLNDVNDGARNNRSFLYVTVPSFAAIGLLPWVATFRSLVYDSVQISICTCIISVFAGVFTVIAFVLLLTGTWLGIFPIPFLAFSIGTAALPVVILTILALTPALREDAMKEKMNQCLKAFMLFLLVTFIVLVWAVLFYKLHFWNRTNGQMFWSFLYGPLRFFCKMILFAPTVEKLRPTDWIIYTFTIDIFFARVQMAVSRFTSFYSATILLFSSFWSLLWRIFAGEERCGLIYEITKAYFYGENLSTFAQEISRSEKLGENVLAILTASIETIHIASAVTNSSTMPQISKVKEPEYSTLDHCDINQESDGNSIKCETVIEHPVEETAEIKESNKYLFTSLTSQCTKVCRNVQWLLRCGFLVPNHLISETQWEQRMLFHVVDAIGAECFTIIVRIQSLIAFLVIRFTPFIFSQVEDFFFSADNMGAKNYGFLGLVVLILNVGIVSFFGWIFRKTSLRRKGICMTRVLSYIFYDHSWLLVFWLSATGMFVTTSMVKHYGADFTMKFNWLHDCKPPNMINYPSCTRNSTGLISKASEYLTEEIHVPRSRHYDVTDQTRRLFI